MKRIISMIAALVIISATAALGVSADDAKVLVTVANGDLVAAEEISLSDTDGDGRLTVNDALTLLHAEKGKDYEAKNGDFGLYITKLWGAQTSSVGYTVNNAFAMSLTDEVKDGDHVAAYIYTDPAFSDAYSYFDSTKCSLNAGGELTLTLSSLGYDENWQTVVSAVAGADIYVDGVKTEYKTDESGKVTLSLSDGGRHIISAKSESKLLVPPVCVVNVTAYTPVAPKTGDSTVGALAISGVALVGVAVFVGICHRKNEE